jgi:Flp pilus assembly protein protease CpaA
MHIASLPVIVVVGAVLVAVCTDVRSLKVYNWLTIPLLIAGITFHTGTAGTDGLLSSLLNALIVFAILLTPYILGAIGAGDLKLLAAVAAWLGIGVTFQIAAVGFFATGVYSLAVLARQGRLGDAWLHFKLSMCRLQMLASHVASDSGHETVHEMAANPEGRARLVPFSAMLAVGIVVILAWQFWQA